MWLPCTVQQSLCITSSMLILLQTFPSHSIGQVRHRKELRRWRAVDGLLAAGREEGVITQKQMCSFMNGVSCFQSLVVFSSSFLTVQEIDP
uniref:Putative secreted protein n=1 Tax=Ixodes ricinus TaxID=34613 RepID=A0A147BR24_IXORI